MGNHLKRTNQDWDALYLVSIQHPSLFGTTTVQVAASSERGASLAGSLHGKVVSVSKLTPRR